MATVHQQEFRGMLRLSALVAPRCIGGPSAAHQIMAVCHQRRFIRFPATTGFLSAGVV